MLEYFQTLFPLAEILLRNCSGAKNRDDESLCCCYHEEY